MPRASAVVLVIIAAVMAVSAYAGDNASNQKVLFEVAVKLVSDDAYLELVRQAWSKGWRFTPEQIEAGSKRHFQELKLQLIDQGFIILPGETGS